MSDACVGPAGTLLADIRRSTLNLQHRGSFVNETNPRAGPTPTHLSLFLAVVITLNTITLSQLTAVVVANR